jgi:hypothetical protein
MNRTHILFGNAQSFKNMKLRREDDNIDIKIHKLISIDNHESFKLSLPPNISLKTLQNKIEKTTNIKKEAQLYHILRYNRPPIEVPEIKELDIPIFLLDITDNINITVESKEDLIKKKDNEEENKKDNKEEEKKDNKEEKKDNDENKNIIVNNNNNNIKIEKEKSLALRSYEYQENRLVIFIHDRVSPVELRKENDKNVQYKYYQKYGYSNYDYPIECEKTWSVNKLKEKICEELKKGFF